MSAINKIVDEITLLSESEVVLPTRVSNQADHGYSESMQGLEVQVSCTEGTLKLNEKVCRRRM